MPPELLGNVVNINIPGPSCHNVKGLFLATMSRSTVLCGFRSVSGQLRSEAVRRTDCAADDPDVQVLTNTKVSFRECVPSKVCLLFAIRCKVMPVV